MEIRGILMLTGDDMSDSPKMPLVLLIYGMQTILTTATCIAEYLSWTEITFQEKIDLTMLYGPYLAIGEYLHLFHTRLLSKSNRD